MQSESELQSEVLKLLKASGLLYFRVPLGGVRHGGIRKRNPMTGFPDIAGYSQQGRGWTFELKRLKGSRMSEEQIEWARRLEDSNVLHFVIRRLEDAIEALVKIKAS